MSGTEILEQVNARKEAVADMERQGMAKASPSSSKKPFQKGDYDRYRVKNILKTVPPEIAWLILDSLLRKTFGLIVAPPGTGKSFFALQLLAAIAAGKGLFGYHFVPRENGAVLGVFCEEDADILNVRVKTVVKRMLESIHDETQREMISERIENNMFTYPGFGENLLLLKNDGKSIAESEEFNLLTEFAKGIENLSLIVIDPMSRVYGQDENSNSIASIFCTLMERLAHETGATVLCVHHTNKVSIPRGKSFNLESALHQDSIRGATAFTGASRWQLNMVSLPGAWAQKEFKLDNKPKDGEFIAIKVVKKNYGPPEDVLFLRRTEGGYLEFFDLKNIEEFDTIDEAIIDFIINEVKKSEASGNTLMTRTHVKKNLSKHLKESGHSYTQSETEYAVEKIVKSGKLSWVKRTSSDTNRTVECLVTVQ
ncbi:MAG: AAA family ATPase [Humidesulfovibrio sp.]|uniref:AAA family ATPase n=1 Tax=Humidesulfovibrio sp. TaxID=2910988 RepID=UPI002735AFC1|nr:AAA family ATPase [Humidesulfovibrio sp.]MDP2849359.1 AAA family ATPase [Humidesulfovibrio sp.]